MACIYTFILFYTIMLCASTSSACSFSLPSRRIESSFGANMRYLIVFVVNSTQLIRDTYSKQIHWCTSSLISGSRTCEHPSNVSLVSRGQCKMICCRDSSVICVQSVIFTSSILLQCLSGERSVMSVQRVMSMMRSASRFCSAVSSEICRHPRTTHDCN